MLQTLHARRQEKRNSKASVKVEKYKRKISGKSTKKRQGINKAGLSKIKGDGSAALK